MKNVIETARTRIARFCEVNHIALNEELINIPVYEIKDFFVGRDQSGEYYTEDEARKELGDSEARCLPFDDLTGKPAILYDAERMEAHKSFEYKVQIIIHEFMHYKDTIEWSLEDNPDPMLDLFDVLNYDELDVESTAEALSHVIVRYPEMDLEEAFERLSASSELESLISSYDDVELGDKILHKIYTMTIEDARMVLE